MEMRRMKRNHHLIINCDEYYNGEEIEKNECGSIQIFLLIDWHSLNNTCDQYKDGESKNGPKES